MSEIDEVVLAMLADYLLWSAGSRRTESLARQFVERQMMEESTQLQQEVARALYDLVRSDPFR